MKQLLILISTLFGSAKLSLFDFDQNANLENWTIVNDGVMGGLSQGSLKINSKGNGVFHGFVTTENNGGFSSLRYNTEKIDLRKYNTIQLRLKGDQKQYQIRIKSNRAERHSYVYRFATNGEWQTIEIPLDELTPNFRGRSLNMPNYPRESLEEFAFLIGNKVNEDFKLEIDKILFLK